MGGSVAKGFPNQAASASLSENLNQPNLGQATGGRHGIPGGPTLPPHNPLAATGTPDCQDTKHATKVARLIARCKPEGFRHPSRELNSG